MSASKRLPLCANMVDSAPFGAGWSSLAARRAHNPKVVGSNPTPATNFIQYRGPWRRFREILRDTVFSRVPPARPRYPSGARKTRTPGGDPGSVTLGIPPNGAAAQNHPVSRHTQAAFPMAASGIGSCPARFVRLRTPPRPPVPAILCATATARTRASCAPPATLQECLERRALQNGIGCPQCRPRATHPLVG